MQEGVSGQGLKLRAVPIGTLLNLRTTTTSQKCEAVPRRARISGSETLESLNSRLESNEAEKAEIVRESISLSRANGAQSVVDHFPRGWRLIEKKEKEG